MAQLNAFFQDIKLPTVPEVGQSLIHTLNDEEVPFERVRGAISKDPALTAKLVRLANSARFALPPWRASTGRESTMHPLRRPVRSDTRRSRCASSARFPRAGSTNQCFEWWQTRSDAKADHPSSSRHALGPAP